MEIKYCPKCGSTIIPVIEIDICGRKYAAFSDEKGCACCKATRIFAIDALFGPEIFTVRDDGIIEINWKNYKKFLRDEEKIRMYNFLLRASTVIMKLQLMKRNMEMID